MTKALSLLAKLVNSCASVKEETEVHDIILTLMSDFHMSKSSALIISINNKQSLSQLQFLRVQTLKVYLTVLVTTELSNMENPMNRFY